MDSSLTQKTAELDTTERIRLLEMENRQLRQTLESITPDRPDCSTEYISEHQRERKLRSILDHLPAMVGYWDKDLRNHFCNHAYLKWFGLEPAVIPGMHIRELLGEERYQLNLPFIGGVLLGKAQQFERMIPKPEGGGIRHALVNYIPDIIDGKVLGFYVLATETTALHDAQEALRASEERYRTVIEDQTEVISRIAVDGTFIFVNSVFCRFFGKTAEELLGRTWVPGCHPDDLPLVEAHLRTLSPIQPTVVIENRVWSGADEWRWMQFVNHGYFDASGRLLEVQSVGRDISDRKKAELALREAHDQLEQRVIQRTEQLRRLAIQTTLAEERERQAIARDLHDGLGQLLHVAKVKLDVLASQLPASAISAADDLDALLADASRETRSLTTQLSPPVLVKLGLPHALRWLVEEMNRLYGLNVFVSGGAGCPTLMPAQASILFRAARELLINAAKYSGVGLAHLHMTCSNEQLILTVADPGVGIPDVAKAMGETKGFGLASIRERLTYLGGEMEIVSVPGNGLRVSLHMPLKVLPLLE